MANRYSDKGTHPSKASTMHWPLNWRTEAEAAEHVGVSVETLRLWRTQGRGPTRRSDGTYLTREVELWAEPYKAALVYTGRAA